MVKLSKILFGLFLFLHHGVNAQQNHVLITAQMDTVRNIKILPSKKLTNSEQVTYLTSANDRVIVPAKKLHSFYNGTYHVSESLGKRKTSQMIIGYEIRGPLSFGYAQNKKGDYTFYLKQGTEVLEVPKDEEKVYKKVVGYVINGDSFANYYKKDLYPEYKSLAEYTSAYNAYVSPKKYKAKKYTYLENPKPSAYFSVNYDDIKVQSFNMKYSFNAGVAIENAYSRNLKVMFIPNIGVAKYRSDLTNFDVDIKTIGIESALGWSLKGEHNKIDLIIGPTLGAKYFFDSEIKREIGDNVIKTQAIETLKVSYGASAWLRIADRFTATLRYTTYDIKFSATSFDNITGASNNFAIQSYQLGLLYRLN